MARSHSTWLAAVLIGSGCLLTAAAASGVAQDAKQQPAKGEVLLSKSASLTADDEKDGKPRTSHRKVYTIKLAEGKAYRIDLSSKDFAPYLRLEDARGKEVGFGDERILYLARQSGEYRVIVTAFIADKGDATTGAFKLAVTAATEAETAEARLQDFASATPAEQQALVAEVLKDFLKKGAKVTLKDARVAYRIALNVDEGDIKFARSTIAKFIQVFDGAADKELAGLSRFLEGELKKLAKIGTEFDVAGKTIDGKDFALKNLKGKVVLVDFWATWCGPCVGEIPNIVAAHKKYARQGFVVIGVSLDDDNEDVAKFMAAEKLPWKCINVADSQKLAEKYGVKAIPYPVLVGRDGRIVSLRARGPQLERLLERLLTETK